MASPDVDVLPVTVVSQGEYFGEIAIVHSKPRPVSAVALEYSTILSLNRDDIDVLEMTWPQVKDDFIASAEAFLANLQMLKEEQEAKVKSSAVPREGEATPTPVGAISPASASGGDIPQT